MYLNRSRGGKDSFNFPRKQPKPVLIFEIIFYNQGRSVSTQRISLIVNLGMFEMSCRFKTWHGDSLESVPTLLSIPFTTMYNIVSETTI